MGTAGAGGGGGLQLPAEVALVTVQGSGQEVSPAPRCEMIAFTRLLRAQRHLLRNGLSKWIFQDHVDKRVPPLFSNLINLILVPNKF